MKSELYEIIENVKGTYHGNLRYYFNLVFNSPNVNNPYHNFRHSIYVLVCCYEGGRYEHLSQSEMRILLIAALFHDFGHSGIMGNDPAQIKVAKAGLKKYLHRNDKKYFKEIEILIDATMWPHDESKNLSISAKIIRDADMSQSVTDIWFQQNIFGLAVEFGVTPYQQLVNQIAFLNNLKLSSSWGENFVRPKIQERLDDVKYYVDLLKT